MTWYSTQPDNPYPLARIADCGNVRVLFGKHANKLLMEVPDQYLRWLSGAEFVPEDLADLVEDELVRRGDLTLPDLRDREAVCEFLRAAGTSLEAIAHLGEHLRDLLADAEDALDELESSRAEALEAALRRAFGTADDDT